MEIYMNVLYYFSKLIKKIQIPAQKNSQINKKSKVCSGSHIVNSRIDKYSYIGNFCTIIEVDIGKFCSIADNCIIGGASHPLNWVSTSPVFHEGKNIMNKNFSKHKYETSRRTIIENDVWVGNNCLIKSGVKLSTGAIVGMGSVVTKDIGPYEIWGGNPAKLIKKRFDDNTIKALLESNWWLLSDEELKRNARYFNEVKEYIKRVGI